MSSQLKWRAAAAVCVAVALFGAAWAALAGSAVGCDACESAAELLGGKAVAWAGVGLYLLLLAMFVLGRWTRLAGWGVGLASGVHVGLVALLLFKSLGCVPCVVTALGAWSALTVILVGGLLRWLDAGAVVVAGLTLACVGILVAWKMVGWSYDAQARRMMDNLLATEPPVPAAHARVIVYVREGCPHCKYLREVILPPLERRMEGRLEVVYRDAPSRMPTPIIFMLGSRNKFFVGETPEFELRRAVEAAAK
ncbi:MAG: hypothetical protein BIFFINMI_01645 [Phycisphaerae bacterium]|nr:hypothetical protein [Phycisphaerae bacterium]